MSLDDLVALAGPRAQRDAAIGPRTTYRVGGSASLLLTPRDEDEATALLAAASASAAATVVLGNGSNLLVEDGSHDVVVVQLGDGFASLEWRDEGEDVLVVAGAALALPVAARRLAAQGVTGFEWAVGVPGTLGGAVAMNAGGHGADLDASIVEALVYSSGERRTWSRQQLGLGYRRSALAPGDVVLSVTLRLARGDRAGAEERVREVVRWRREHQPGGANGGSVFRNPEGDHAARLIEAAGAKGLRVGSAAVSEKHANFIQADPGGRANDVRALMDEVRERVARHAGVTLVSEHRFIGFGETS